MHMSSQAIGKLPTDGRGTRNPQRQVAVIELGKENQHLVSLVEHVKAEYPSFGKSWLSERIVDALSANSEVFARVEKNGQIIPATRAEAVGFCHQILES